MSTATFSASNGAVRHAVLIYQFFGILTFAQLLDGNATTLAVIREEERRWLLGRIARTLEARA
jgi:hypothetical protein